MLNSSSISMRENPNVLPSFIGIPYSVQIWMYLTSDVLSLVCSLLILYYLLFHQTLRHALCNHTIIILLFMGIIYELTSIPWILHRFFHGGPWIYTPVFYLFSFFFDYGIYATQIIFFTWTTIERHILIFHDQWVSTKKKRFFVHYLPTIAILIYCFLFYTLVTFGPFCENSFEAFITIGVYIPCVFNKTILGTWDLLVHQVIPTLLIVIFSIALIVRVVWQKQRMNRSIQWRRHRTMTIQLLSISILYLVFNLPWTIVIFASQYGLSENDIAIPMIYVIFFRAYVIFLFPFVYCGSLSEFRSKFKRLLHCKRRNQIIAAELLQMART